MRVTKGTHSKLNGRKANVSGAANLLLKESKKLANEIYEDGLHKVNHQVNKAEESFKEYSDTLINKIQENPVSSVLIAGGIGFLLSMIIRK